MDAAYSTVILWSYGLATLTYVAVSISVAQLHQTMGRGSTRGWVLAAASLSAAWAASEFLRQLSPFWLLDFFAMTLDTLRQGAWLGLLIDMLYREKSAGPIASRMREWWPAAVAILLTLVGLGFQWAKQFDVGAFDRLAQFCSLGAVVFGLSLTEQLFRNTPEDARWKVKPIGIALVATFAFDLYFHSLTLLFNKVDADAYTVRGLAAAIVAPLIVLTIYRAKARRLDITLSKTAVFQTTSLAIAGAYLIVASVAGYYVRYLGGSWGGALQITIIFAALLLFLLLLLSGSVRSRIKVLIGKHFFSLRYDYREEWLKFTSALSMEDDPRQAGPRIIRALADMVESPGGSLWMRDPDTGALMQTSRWNLPQCDVREPADSSMMQFLADNAWIINLEEYRHLPGRYQHLQLPEWLTTTPNAWLIVPLATATGLVGFVTLTTSRTEIDVNWEVNDLLRTAGRQAANYLAGIQATEALLEARKFDAFNRMSAFVVHDLKNIVTQLSLMVRNAERHADNPEFQRDMLLTVSNSVDRMKQLLLQLREGATPPDRSVGVSLEQLIRRICKSKAHLAPAVEIVVDERIVVRGHEERIERVLGHLVQNALEATPGDGRVWVKIGRAGGMARVEVGDTGRGMSEDFVRNQLFKPFQTTKDTGMGIGAYESRQYIRELGGEIQVETTENAGSRFIVTLPLIERSSASDLMQQEKK
jgi:putative PEP-CTERM system histidine kinase